MKIICLGDSLTAGCGLRRGENWVELLREQTGDEWINAGVCGDTSTGILVRLQTEVLPQRPDEVLLMGGDNDIMLTSCADQAKSAMMAMIHQCAARGVKPVVGIQCIDNKLYYFNADGVLEKGKTFGVDVSKYQKNIDWNQIKKAGVSFVIVRIGYRGYGAAGTLVLDPMFEEHFTNVKNAGLKVGVYFFSQATTEAEAREEAFACAYVLNGRKLDYPIFFDTEASGASNGSGRADGLGMEDRTKCAIAFCEEVKAQGYKPGVYASTLWYRKRIDLNSLKKYTIWNAHYGVASSPIDCALWQGTCTARLPGYKGDMDVNISYIG